MKIILIGSSTGGPHQLKFLLSDIDIKNTCVIIAQHMSLDFIPSFAKQFNKEAVSEVKVLKNKENLTHKIYICEKNTVLGGNLNPIALYSEESTSFKPGINLLFHSAISLTKTHKILAIILTGMGDDGAKSLFELYKNGASCLCESEKDCIVYGMPKKAKELNPHLKQLSLQDIKKEILHFIEE